MRDKFQHCMIEPKWQQAWEHSRCFDLQGQPGSKTHFSFDSAPFPNGRLHLGHVRNYVLGDVYARYKRLTGFNVLYTTGFDAFGLPNQLAAEKNNLSAHSLTHQYIEQMSSDLRRLGVSYAWGHVKATCDPAYYRWTQWLFLELYKEGLVYREQYQSNWCPDCQTSLSHMEIEDSVCNRCGTRTEYRYLSQWKIRVSDCLEELYDSIGELDQWSARARNLLQGFFAPVEGFQLPAHACMPKTTGEIEVFVPRGIAQENPYRVISSCDNNHLSQIIVDLETNDPGRAESLKKAISDMVHVSIGQHPHRRTRDRRTNRKDYDTGLVLEVGTEKLRLPLWISPHVDLKCGPQIFVVGDEAVAGSRLSGGEGDTGQGTLARHFHIHDWNVSRRKSWGTPLPILSCVRCGMVPVDQECLPVLHSDHRNAPQAFYCSKCGGYAEQVNETLDCYFDDCWCFIAGAAPELDSNPFRSSHVRRWLSNTSYHAGFDIYTYLHTYRFIAGFLYKKGLISAPDMFAHHQGHDMVMQDGRKISKRNGNNQNLDWLIDRYGADTLRLAVMSAAGPNKPLLWNEDHLSSARYFLSQLFNLYAVIKESNEGSIVPNRALLSDKKRKSVSRHFDKEFARAEGFYETYRPNAASQVLRKLVGELKKLHATISGTGLPGHSDLDFLANLLLKLVITLSPLIPHLCEEIWSGLDGEGFVSMARWPKSH